MDSSLAAADIKARHNRGGGIKFSAIRAPVIAAGVVLLIILSCLPFICRYRRCCCFGDYDKGSRYGSKTRTSCTTTTRVSNGSLQRGCSSIGRVSGPSRVGSDGLPRNPRGTSSEGTSHMGGRSGAGSGGLPIQNTP